MKIIVVTLVLCACLAAADVSHLPTGYLPPVKSAESVSTTIEQQELRELPVQVEYMRENDEGMMEAAPSSLLTPPADEMQTMPEDMQMVDQQYMNPQQMMMMEEPQPQMMMEEEPQQQMMMEEAPQQQMMMEEPQQMPYYDMEVEQPMAASDKEIEMHQNGYHYPAVSEEQRLRH